MADDEGEDEGEALDEGDDYSGDEPNLRRLPFGEGERRLLLGLITSLRGLIVDGRDPSLSRLRPTAYLDDPDQEAAWQLLARSELDDHRLTALATVERTLELGQVSDAQLHAWLTSLNAMRLVLGTQLAVTDDDDEDDEDLFDPDDPDAERWAVYSWLGGALDWVVRQHTFDD